MIELVSDSYYEHQHTITVILPFPFTKPKKVLRQSRHFGDDPPGYSHLYLSRQATQTQSDDPIQLSAPPPGFVSVMPFIIFAP